MKNGKLLEIKLGGSKEKVDQSIQWHMLFWSNVSIMQINYLDGTFKNTVENKEKKLKEAEERLRRKLRKTKKRGWRKEVTERSKEEEQEKARPSHTRTRKPSQTHDQQIQVGY